MDKNLLVAVFVVVAISSLFLISLSITGMVSLSDEPFTRPLCVSDSDCVSPDVCCYFYGSESGVCHDITMCQEVLELTAQPRMEQPRVLSEDSSKNEYLAGLILGVALIGFVIYFSEKALSEKSKA